MIPNGRKTFHGSDYPRREVPSLIAVKASDFYSPFEVNLSNAETLEIDCNDALLRNALSLVCCGVSYPGRKLLAARR